jgi:hypothetical protein
MPLDIARRAVPLFAVGLKVRGKADHTVIDADDALIAALKVKVNTPEAEITYVRRANKRGDTRHPPHALKKESRGTR